MLQISNEIVICESELDERFIRASGPGGQNVNKVASAVQLRFNVRDSDALPDGVKMRAMRLAGSRLTKDGEVVITADSFRRQDQNRAEARRRLRQLLLAALPAPKRRKKPKRNMAAVRKRLEEKSRRSQTKQLRRRPETG